MASMFQTESADEVYPLLVRTVMKHGDAVVPYDKLSSSKHPTREIRPVVIELAQPRRRLIASRPINVAFALAEVLWILAGRRDVGMLQSYNSNIGHFSDDGVEFNAAYGYRLRRAFEYDQIDDVIATLRHEPDSRQAILQVWDPRADRGDRKTKDRACNVLGMLKIRDGRLHLTVINRSNDLIWGLPYNLIQWTHVQEWIAAHLGVPTGHYTHVTDSLHIYERHFDEAERILVEFESGHVDFYSLCRADHRRMSALTMQQLRHLLSYERNMRTLGHRMLPHEALGDDILHTYWEQILLALLAHHFYRDGDNLACARTLTRGDLIYGAAQARFYMKHRWLGMEDTGALSAIQDTLATVYSPECLSKIHIDGRL